MVDEASIGVKVISTMGDNYFPLILDWTRDECKMKLRSLELLGYAGIVTAFRAQGDLNSEKRRILETLCSLLYIPNERHRAEIRRAVNNEKLCTISYQMSGSSHNSEWAIEGRRVTPMMPRLVPQTVFTAVATKVATLVAQENAKLPPPSTTRRKKVPETEVGSHENMSSTDHILSSHNLISPMPSDSNMVVLPSGMAIHISGEDEIPCKRRKGPPVEIFENIPHVVETVSVTETVTTKARSCDTPPPIMKPSIGQQNTIFNPPVTTTANVSSVSQKVIRLGSNTAGTPHKTIGIKGHPPSSLSVPHVQPGPQGIRAKAPGGIAGNADILKSIPGPSKTPGLSVSTAKVRVPTTRVRPPFIIPQQKPAFTIPQPINRPLQIKKDGSLKIISQSVPIASVSGGAKILPRPYTTNTGSPVYVVNSSAGSLTTTNIRTTCPVPRVLTVSSSNSPILTTTTQHSAASKPVQTLRISTGGPGAVRGLTGSGGVKPNVIVVQKRGVAHSVVLGQGTKDIVSRVTSKGPSQHQVAFSQGMKNSPSSRANTTSTTSTYTTTPHGIPPGVPSCSLPTGQGNVIVVGLSQEQLLSKGSYLADILQATGILNEGNKTTTITTQQAHEGNIPMVMDGSEITVYEEDITSENVKMEEPEITEIQQPESQLSLKEVTLPLDIPEGKVVTLQEAVEILARTNSEEARELLREAGVEIRDVLKLSEDSGQVPVSAMQGTPLTMEGHLNPETGLFTLHSPAVIPMDISTDITSVVETTSTTTDIFRTALDSADINLESFQFETEETMNTEGEVVTISIPADINIEPDI